MFKKVFITGGAGYIGSTLCDYLTSKNYFVTVYDNFSTGNIKFIKHLLDLDNFNLVKADLLDIEKLILSIKGHDFVFHLAANADVRFGLENPYRDLEQNTIVTFNVLEAMRKANISKIAFSSTGSIYGEAKEIPTPENTSFPIQTSLYGSSKLAGESLIQSYCEGFGFQSWIFRFVSILGERYTHGHVFDFFKKLKKNPSKLEVLGNGKQRKSYLYVQDCINAMIIAIEKSNDKNNIFNLGLDSYCEVNDSIKWICDDLQVNPKLIYSGGDKGWVGDNPFIYLDTKKIRNIGWTPNVSIKEGVIKTVRYLKQNQWVFDERE